MKTEDPEGYNRWRLWREWAILHTSLRPHACPAAQIIAASGLRWKKNDRIHGISLFVISEQYLPWQVWCGRVHLLDISSYGTHKHRELWFMKCSLCAFLLVSQHPLHPLWEKFWNLINSLICGHTFSIFDQERMIIAIMNISKYRLLS